MENSTYDKVKALRSDPADNSEVNFKKVPFGGYDCNEVTQYLKNLKSNMLLSEKAYNDKFEEYSSASKMHVQERELLNKKIKEKDEEIVRLKTSQMESATRERDTAMKAQKEITELRSLVSNLQQRIDSEQNQASAKMQEEGAKENRRLTEEINELTEAKEKLSSHNGVLTNECNRISKHNEKCLTEIDDLKKTITALRISKRNAAMSTNMRVFEYQQNHQLGIESINSSICDISDLLSTMKADLADFCEKSKIDLKDENIIGHL